MIVTRRLSLRWSGSVVLAATVVATALPGATACAQAQQLPSSQEPVTMPLWSGPAPGAQGTEAGDIPTMTMYMPRGAAGPRTAIVLAPGGGYINLAMNHEGRQVANYLNSVGVVVFVLQYRLGPKYRHPIELGDMQRAIRTVRARAEEWRVAPDRVGVMGFSAGGHLAASASTYMEPGNPSATDPIDRQSSRPDFAILGYPVISLTEAWAHGGSRDALLGPDAAPALAGSLSLDTRVSKETPPTFLFHTNADTAVPAENSLTYFMALRKAGVPAELHIFRNGGHGVGLGMTDPALAEWPRLLLNWMRVSGWLK